MIIHNQNSPRTLAAIWFKLESLHEKGETAKLGNLLVKNASNVP